MHVTMLSGREFRVLILRERAGEEDLWVAQCLEHDIVAQGKTFAEMRHAFEMTVLAEVQLAIDRNEKPLQGIPAAPEKFHRMWDEAVRLDRREAIHLSEFLRNGIQGRSPALDEIGDAEMRLAPG